MNWVSINMGILSFRGVSPSNRGEDAAAQAHKASHDQHKEAAPKVAG